MSGNEPITIASVRDFMLKNDSKVKNHDLVTHFRQQLNDPANKNKVRGDFKEIVHQLATVQEIEGDKYFVLKRTKEAPAVLRKPPSRQHPSHKARPVSGPPSTRNTKMFEEMLSNQQSKGHPPGTLGHVVELDKENRSGDVKGLSKNYMMSAASVDSINSTGSGGSTPRQARKVSQTSKKTSENEDQLSQISADDLLDDQEMEGYYDNMAPTIQLEAIEKEWILTAARGNRANIMCLLEQEPSLVKKKDFTSGYTALHWAAKHGREDIVAMLVKKGIDVNSKSHGGYTPLHLASMHGHDKVIKILVDEFDANIDSRDNSGRKPKQMAKNTLTIEAQRRLEHSLHDAPYGGSHSQAGRKKAQPNKQYGSINSIITPSAALVGYYGGDQPVKEAPQEKQDKQRERASSFGKFLHKKEKKKQKKERAESAQLSEYATSSAGLLIGSPQQLKQVEDERRENEMDIHRTHSDPEFKLTSEI